MRMALLLLLLPHTVPLTATRARLLLLRMRWQSGEAASGLLLRERRPRDQGTTDAAFQLLLQVGYVLVQTRVKMCCCLKSEARTTSGAYWSVVTARLRCIISLTTTAACLVLSPHRLVFRRIVCPLSLLGPVPQRLPCTYSRVVSPHHTSPLHVHVCATALLSQPLQHHLSFAPSIKYGSAATLHPPLPTPPGFHPCHMSSLPSNPFPPTAP